MSYLWSIWHMVNYTLLMLLELLSLPSLRTRSEHPPEVTILHQPFWANEGSILEGSFKLLIYLVPCRHGLGSGIFFTQEETLTLPQSPRFGSCRCSWESFNPCLSIQRREGYKPEMVHFQVCLDHPAAWDPQPRSPDIQANALSTTLWPSQEPYLGPNWAIGPKVTASGHTQNSSTSLETL